MRHPDADLTFHSDRDVQYTSFALQKLLKTHQVKQSFSPVGKPRHNAVMESFFASLKREELYRRNYHSVAEFYSLVEAFIHRYDTECPHSTLQYQTPDAYECSYFKQKE